MGKSGAHYVHSISSLNPYYVHAAKLVYALIGETKIEEKCSLNYK
jgi:hypothetical protein